ncbi:unnamed protein product [Durusdinium trenchii]|uniref:RanBP2-type domain-containing protein n=1 Tax=Durusdinium trenchii TaxID=1381693 RepID=A0ABP0JJI9_9DINO
MTLISPPAGLNLAGLAFGTQNLLGAYGAQGLLGVQGTPGEWVCACGFRNRDSNLKCGGNGPMGCKSPKPGVAVQVPQLAPSLMTGLTAYPTVDSRVPAAFQAAAQLAQMAPVAPISYGPQRTRAIPGGASPYGGKAKSAPGVKSGDWKCRCGFSNKAANQLCGGGGELGCKAAKEWICGLCMFVNKNSNLVCGGAGGTLGCKAPNPAEVGGVLAGAKLPQWACPCGFLNKVAEARLGPILRRSK